MSHKAGNAAAAAPGARAQDTEPPVLTLYTRPGCHLCEQALEGLQRMQRELRFTVRELDITSEESLHRAYFERIPVITLDGHEICEYFLHEDLVRERLESRT